MNVIERIFKRVQIQLDLLLNDWQLEIQALVDSFSLKWFSPSPIHPGVPRGFTAALDFVTNVLDAVGNRLASIPALVVAEVVVSAFPVPEWLGTRVMRADDAIRFPIEVLISYGIQSSGPPQEWKMAQQALKAQKLLDFIRFPTAARFLKALLGGFWGKIITILLLLVRVIGYLAICLVIYWYLRSWKEVVGLYLLSQSKQRERWIASSGRRRNRLLLRVPHK